MKPEALYWRMQYRFAGKEKLLALGVYPEISLKAGAGGKRIVMSEDLATGITIQCSTASYPKFIRRETQ